MRRPDARDILAILFVLAGALPVAWWLGSWLFGSQVDRILDEYLLLYFIRKNQAIFLSIKHHRQLSFDLHRFWP